MAVEKEAAYGEDDEEGADAEEHNDGDGSDDDKEPTISEKDKKIISEIYSLHQRVGHVPYKKIIEMVKNGRIAGASKELENLKNVRMVLDKMKKMICGACMKGRMTRKAMTGVVEYPVEGILDMWVADIMGPIKHRTHDGKRYILVIMDVYSHKIFVELLKRKSDATEAVIRIIKREELQTERKVKRFGGDGGGEFVNKKLGDFFTEKGIVHTWTTADTPQHNALVERVNRTLCEKTRTMMWQVRAWTRLWGEAILTAAYLFNRTPSEWTGTATPNEVYHGTRTTHKYTHVWGCDVHVHVKKEKRENKFDSTSNRCVFVKHDEYNAMHFYVYDVKKQKVIKVSDVRFEESEYQQMRKLVSVKRDDDDSDSDSDTESVKVGSVNHSDYLDLDSLSAAQIKELFGGPTAEQQNNISTSSESDSRRDSDREVNDDRNNSDSDSANNIVKNNDLKNNSDRGSIDNESDIQSASAGRRVNNSDSERRDNVKRRDMVRRTDNERRSDNSESEHNNKRVIKVKHNEVSDTEIRRSSRATARPPSYDERLLYTQDADYEVCMSTADEPLTYEQAVNSEHSEEWLKAMKEEWDSLIENETWEEVKRESSENMNVVGVKWVFKVKKNEKGEPVRYKARMIAKGYTQEYGVDYHETYAPVLKYKTLRIMMALSVGADMVIEQMDVKTAFLNANVNEHIYIDVPEGMKLQVSSGAVLRLRKALYGIKQASHEWNKHINAFLESMGFKRCVKDTCLYVKITTTGQRIIIGLFVDDITAAYSKRDKEEWMKVKTMLMSKYKLSSVGEVQHIVGMRVEKRSDGTVWIDQQAYVEQKLQEFGMSESRPMSTPETITKKIDGDKELSEEEMETYRAIVGSLIYASTSTRPDITHAVNIATRKMKEAKHSDMVNVKRTLRYLCGTKTLGLYYKGKVGSMVKIEGYTDADWGGDLADRKSTSGYAVLINGNVVSWASKKQRVVALSTAEAEWIAVTECVKEMKWMMQLMGELGYTVETPMTVYEDNQSTIKICENDVLHERVKHVDLDYHWIRDNVKEKLIELKWVPSQEELADMFTKSLGRVVFERLRGRMMTDRVKLE